jgi:hypothetical protein
MLRRVITAVTFFGLVAAACAAPGGEGGSSSEAPGLPRFGPDTTIAAAASAAPGVGVTAASERVTAVAAGFDPESVRFVAALERFDSCDALLGYFHAEGLDRVGPYGLSGGPAYYPGPWLFAAAESAGGVPITAAGPADAGANTGYSTTNVQVPGVDEPDTIKTDGGRILTVMNGTLYYVEVDGADARLVGSLPLEGGWDHRFFMSGDRALVFSQGDGYAVPLMESSSIAPTWAGPVTLVQEIDLSDPARLRVARTLRIEGRYLSARAIDGTVRVVISSYPSDLPFVYPSNPAAEELALETNRRVVEQSALEDWLPSYTLFAGDEEMEQGLLVDCEETHRPAEFAGFDTLSVLTLDLGGPLAPGAVAAVIAQGETVYASTEHLYVATNVWVPETLAGDASLEEIDDQYSTAIHAFDITGDGPARYLASGSVDGHLLNQFAMDEYEGHLRVATTAGAPWNTDQTSESAVTVLALGQGTLSPVGRVGDLGKGESIYSVRFVGPTGYVVTFRQVDPLYVVDLRDPAAPRVSGELKIAGYSAYLHPLGEGRLLGVGRDATEEGQVTGAKVTLFDVSDPADPRAIDTWTLPDGYTDVEFDHLAFLYWAAEEIVVLPMQDWSGGFVGAVVLKTDDGLREVGRVSHDPAEDAGASDCRVVQSELEELKDFTVQVCGPEAMGGLSGHSCELMPAEGANDMLASLGLGALELAADERIEVCWPDYYDSAAPITRSLVVGDTLWTLSWLRLQGNDLADLAVVDEVPLG